MEFLNKEIVLKIRTIIIAGFIGAILLVLSFIGGRIISANSSSSKGKDHSPRATYEAGWRACMRCWDIKSEDGLDFDNATNYIFPDDGSYFEVLISEYYTVTDVSSARTLFEIGFDQCLKHWSISYFNSNRSVSDDISYSFNQWY